MTCGLESCSVPTSIHCDHLIQASVGADADLKVCSFHNAYHIRTEENCLDSAQLRIIRKFLIFWRVQHVNTVCPNDGVDMTPPITITICKGIEFWGPGSGIIHQIVLENYAAPGALMLGTDSHTPNAGGLGGLAIGVGGADAVDAMTDTPWELKAPNIVGLSFLLLEWKSYEPFEMTGIHLTGKMSGWTTPKDLILHIAGRLSVRVRFSVDTGDISALTHTETALQGGTGRILEYFGPGVAQQSCTGLATISNMGAEVGATTSAFPYSENMGAYLRATGRAPVADAADWAAKQGFLAADQGVEYDEVIEIVSRSKITTFVNFHDVGFFPYFQDLAKLEPTINGPFTPDLATPLSKFGAFIKENGWSDELSAGLIGSCTNSSYEDMVGDIITMDG